MPDAVVVGAGLAGLFAARTLVQAGKAVRIVDEGRGVGGRASTFRSGRGVFDHGAQYFTARDPVFRTWVETWLAAGLVNLWSDGFSTASGRLNQNGEPRYIGSRGMSAIAGSLAEGLQVGLEAPVSACRWNDGFWTIEFAATEPRKDPIRARCLVLTAPVPRSLVVLKVGEVPWSREARSRLERIEYSRCLAALIELGGPSRVPAPGGLWLDGEPVAWLADNTQKGISPGGAGAGVSLTLHAGPKFSQAHWDADPDATANKLVDAVRPWLGGPVKSLAWHRWLYSAPTSVYPERCLALREPGPLVFAGDAFAGPRVEGAALSGLAAGEAALSMV